MRKMLRALLVFSTVLIAFSGCGLLQKQIVLHPVTDEDIRQDGDWICMTPDYIQEVMKARLGE